MNPLRLDATQLAFWGLIAHVVADWLLQNDWMSVHKAARRQRRRPDPAKRPDMRGPWWDRHPAAYVHAGIHLVVLAPLFGWVSLPLAVVHLLIDVRTPVAWWARVLRQTMPRSRHAVSPDAADPDHRPYSMEFDDLTFATRWQDDKGREVDAAGVIVPEVEKLRRDLEALKRDMTAWTVPVFDVGTLVRMVVDQAFHVVTIAAAALLVA